FRHELKASKTAALRTESRMCRLSWFLDPGGWSNTVAVGLYFIFPGICTLSLVQIDLRSTYLQNERSPKEIFLQERPPTQGTRRDHESVAISKRFYSDTQAKMGRRQCKSAYNIIKNKTTPESSPPPTPKSDYCNADKAEENDLKKSLMKMLEEAFEEKMKNVSKEIGENTNKKLEEINKEIEEKKSKKLEEMNNKIEEKKNKKLEEMNNEIEEKKNKRVEEMNKEIEEKRNKKLQELDKEIEEKINKKLKEMNKEIEEKTNKKLEDILILCILSGLQGKNVPVLGQVATR
ncbi:hypothetical protein STEG23_010298, partial [Scotinomys teguina]